MSDTQLPKALQLAAMFDHPLPPDWEEMQAAAAELRRLHQHELANIEWIEKTEWVRQSMPIYEIGMHRADVLKQRIEHLEAELEQARAALAAQGEPVAGEPVYQYRKGDGSWIDQSKSQYDYNVQHGAATVRILYTAPPAPAAQNEREANATARAFSLATMAAEEFVRCNGLSTGEPDEFLMTGGYLTDEYATECIEHLKHVGECVAFDCDDGVIVRLGDFTLGSLS